MRKLNAAMADMTPRRSNSIPRFMDTWLRAGWLDEADADEWRLAALAWPSSIAYHRNGTLPESGANGPDLRLPSASFPP